MMFKRIYRIASFSTVTRKVGDFGALAANLGWDVPLQFIARLFQEQNSVRRRLIRIEATRETYFARSSYVIAEIMGVLFILGLVFARTDSSCESVIFDGMILFLLTYLLIFNRDVHDQFEYFEWSG
jgi:hypothetical protein